MTLKTPIARHPRQGLSLVELMVGITVGLFILASATLIAGQQISDNRKLLLETQVQQDLRMAADIMIRMLRQSAYWPDSSTAAWPVATSIDNKFQSNLEKTNGVQEIAFKIGPPEPKVTVTDFAFRKSTNGELQMKIGAADWQAMTDSNTVNVTKFGIDIEKTEIPLPCQRPCLPSGGDSCWPKLTVYDVNINLTGTARHDPTGSVQRSIQAKVRLRNDEITSFTTNHCPS